ncbi:uncharacterized protein LOC119674262 [Teleopsis dalmanni]|uniref:uncharacterized protein LOC119674254 n=1 Tax=Teleopsis dalmanni TaxID=139649 RepID=UPI0018CF1365|nr:uncharacterized protein LOC119674254 [Teleopsis dalmanni]XP_037941322.1 uncharacterized protein LOC119674262 [Teleopsis dalmanni]
MPRLTVFAFIAYYGILNINPQPTSKFIDVLSVAIHAETNIIYTNLDLTNAQEEIIGNTSSPKIIITNETTLVWSKVLHSKILTIVLLDNNALSSEVKSTLKLTLNRFYHTDLLFITTAVLDFSDNLWNDLFVWCWKTGFFNVLLTDVDNSILLRLIPIPMFRYKKSTLEEYLEQRNNWLDLQKYPIQAVVGNRSPRVHVHIDNNGKISLSGLIADYVKLFAKHYNATLQVKYNLNYTLFQCFNYLNTGKAEICIDIFTQINNQIISKPYHTEHGHIMVPYARPVMKYKMFLLPFTFTVWLMLLISILYMTCMMSLIYRAQSKQWNFSSFLLITISSFLSLDFSLKLLHGKSIIVIFFILLITGGIMSIYYLAYLFSLLNTPVFDRQIETIEDMKAINLSIWNDDQSCVIFDQFNTSDTVKEILIYVNGSEFLSHRNRLDPRHSYICFTDTCEILLYQQKFLLRPKVKLLDKPIVTIWTGLPIANNWPLEHMFNIFLLRMFELGFYKHFLTETKETAIRYGGLKFFETEYYSVEPMGIEYFQMPAILLVIGYVSAIISFLLEKFCYFFN